MRYSVKVLRGFYWHLLRLAGGELPLDLSGDRDIEWSWVAANLPDQPGDVLDFGPSSSYCGLIAALRAGKVIGLDLESPPQAYVHPDVSVRKGDLLTYDFGSQRFDTVINCSTVEHVGLSGRYGSPEIPDGDLQAMRRLRELMNGPNSRMVMTIPVGRDGIFAPEHRVYGEQRFPLLISGFSIVREAYYAKDRADRRWKATSRQVAFAVPGSNSFYALGLFVLAPARASV
jgi:hypothetical protein